MSPQGRSVPTTKHFTKKIKNVPTIITIPRHHTQTDRQVIDIHAANRNSRHLISLCLCLLSKHTRVHRHTQSAGHSVRTELLMHWLRLRLVKMSKKKTGCDIILNDAIQKYDSIRYHVPWYNTVRVNMVQHCVMQYDNICCDVLQNNTMPLMPLYVQGSQ